MKNRAPADSPAVLTYVQTCATLSSMELMADNLKKLREGQSLSQEALARLIGVSVRTVARWENGQCKPSPLATEKLLRFAPAGQGGGNNAS
jgi:DNA-binding transcriptional regulator YiaG